MSLIVGSILAFIFLEWPWRGLVIAALACVEGVEIWLWLKLRKMPSSTGAEALVGAHGRAVSDLAPNGMVRVKGQLWRAHCPAGVLTGDHITVVAVRGLVLEVSRRSDLIPEVGGPPPSRSGPTDS